MKKYHAAARAAFLRTGSFVLPALAGFPLVPAFAQVPAQPAATPPRTILEMNAGAEKRFTPSSAQVTVTPSASAAAPGVTVTILPGSETYPSVALKPVGGVPWDFSKFGHVAARLVNTGDKPLTIALRIDNAAIGASNEPWNTESITLAPGASGTVSTLFGYSYGLKRGYALHPGAVVNLLLFTTKCDTAQSFRIEALVADGPPGETPPVAPDDVRVKPQNGLLLGNGIAPSKTVQTVDQVDQNVTLVKPAAGRWDLRDALQVRVRLRNDGNVPVTPRARVQSNGGASEWVSALSPLAAGATGEIVVPFIRSVPLNLGKPETNPRFTSDAVSAVAVSVSEKDAVAPRVLQVQSIAAVLPPAPLLPTWLGKRPPVPGDWVQTLNDDFNGSAIDSTVWDTEGENYYDKTTHWSKKNVLVSGGLARLRYTKQTGYQNDDPKRNQTDYAAGFLNTYGNWTQRYGYFEARMKLPTAPGLWPGFWMMPERGVAAGPEQWKRQDTANGGMEFDIMEHLTRWGPTRYNIAMHYDGYGKDHKNLGSDTVYVQPDKDGFVTCGLLWTPGLAVYYCNGVEVLRWENARISSVPSSLMFTLPSGGWDNAPLLDSALPADLTIDYVRVWQRRDLASLADGKKMAPPTPR